MSSSLPIESPVAWTSMTTGKNPGGHGMYGFMKRNGEKFNATTSESVGAVRLWDRVGKEGEVVVMNVPQTYPPGEVNGSLVGGYLSIKERGYTYPKSLQEELEDKGYSIDAMKGGYEPGKEQKFLESLNKTVEARTASAEMLLDRSDWKLGFVVYTGLDRLQHYFWKYRDGGKHENVIEEHYKTLDAQLGKLLDQKDENTTVMVVSDHGFGELKKNVYLNTWLRKNGYLKLERSENGSSSNAAPMNPKFLDISSFSVTSAIVA